MDFSQALLDKMDVIVEKWVEAVREDERIESTCDLPYKSLLDNLPRVLQAIATVLSQVQENDIQSLVQASLAHGTARAQQGFDAEEMAREYRLLRWIIFSILEEDLLKGSSLEVVRAFRIIDIAIDEAIAQCFKSYSEERLRYLKELQAQLNLIDRELTRLVRDNQENIFQLAREFNPSLASIIDRAELFLNQQPNAEIKDNFRHLEDANLLLSQGRELLRTLVDTVEFYQYEEGKVKLQPAFCNPRDLINTVAELMQPLARAKNLELVVECQMAPERVFTDPLRLQQIVTNIASHAIRFAESGGIKINCQVLPDNQWCVAIAYRRIAVKPQEGNSLFDGGFPLGASSAAEKPPSQQWELSDTGDLGMAIVSRACALQQGRIELDSKDWGDSTIAVILPQEAHASSQAKAGAASLDNS